MKKGLKTSIATLLLGGSLLTSVSVNAAPVNGTDKNNSTSVSVNAASLNKTDKNNSTSAPINGDNMKTKNLQSYPGTYFYITMKYSDVNLRRYPSMDSPVLEILNQGDLLRVYPDQSTPDWAYVGYESPNGYIFGYVSIRYI